ncbi:MAG: hypothetical protein ACXVYY_00940 [Oryzihumus sp.]
MTAPDARAGLVEALTRIEITVALSGSARGLVMAEQMADALIQALAEQGCEVVRRPQHHCQCDECVLAS